MMTGHKASFLLLSVLIATALAAKDAKEKPWKRDELTSAVKELQEKVNGDYVPPRAPNVAFMAQPTEDGDLPKETPILFDNEIFDTANSYDPATGKFVAPYTGVYIFNYQLQPKKGESGVNVDLMKNGETAVRSRVDNKRTKHWPESLQVSVPQSAEAGDVFHVQIAAMIGNGFFGGFRSFFSGALITVDVADDV